MLKENYKKGIFFGIFEITLVGLEPIIANSRPDVLDPYFFAATTCLVQAFLFLPLMLIERKKIKSSIEVNSTKPDENTNLLNGWKNNKLLFIYIGFNFGIAQILFFIGYSLAGAINGSITQKSIIIFALLFGFLINKEKISKTQVIFSFVLLFGLILAVTQGSFNLLEFNMGVLILIVMAILWMIAHALTKPIFDKKESTSIFVVFLRSTISGAALISTYFIFYPIENLQLLFNSENQLFILIMGCVYGFALFFWYKVLGYLGTSKGTAVTSPTPIITALFATIILGEVFTIFHLIGSAIVILSIIIIVKK